MMGWACRSQGVRHEEEYLRQHRRHCASLQYHRGLPLGRESSFGRRVHWSVMRQCQADSEHFLGPLAQVIRSTLVTPTGTIEKAAQVHSLLSAGSIGSAQWMQVDVGRIA